MNTLEFIEDSADLTPAEAAEKQATEVLQALASASFALRKVANNAGGRITRPYVVQCREAAERCEALRDRYTAPQTSSEQS